MRGLMKSHDQRLRIFTWMLHVLVSVLAVFSLLTWRFDLWIDLRWMGWVMGGVVQIGWVLSVLMVPLLGGPVLAGLWRPKWRNEAMSAKWGRRALVPSVVMLGLLVVDGLRYLWMHFGGERYFSPPLPMSLMLAPIFAVWIYGSYRWLRIARKLAATGGTTRWRQMALYGWCGAVMVAGAAYFLVHSAARVPSKRVDVAVVLGMYAPEGRPSPILRDRTLAAIEMYKEGMAGHLLLSGAMRVEPNGEIYDEPSAMKWLCVKEGVPESAITLDPIGFNTRATATNTKRFMMERGYRTVAAVSSESHLARVGLSFKEVGMECYLVPSVRGAWITSEPKAVLREIVGLAVYTYNPDYRPAKGESMKLQSPRILISKKTGTLELFDGPALVKRYSCITGKSDGDKEEEGDRRTPLGTFRVVFRNPDSKFHLSMGLDYPNREYAERGMTKGLISRGEYEQILKALESDLTREENQKKLWYTKLGGEIFIHGHAEGRSGTAGCIALSNEDIEELYAIIPLGTQVEIRE